MTNTAAQLETLSTALTAYQLASMLADSAPSRVTVRAETHARSRLEDAAIECGMDRINEPSLEAWAAERVGAWLCAA